MKTQVLVMFLCLEQLFAASTSKPVLVYARPIPDYTLAEDQIAESPRNSKRSVPPQDSLAFGNNAFGSAGTWGAGLGSQLNSLNPQLTSINPLFTSSYPQNMLGNNNWAGISSQLNPMTQQWNTGLLASTLNSGSNPLLLNRISPTGPTNNMLYSQLLQMGGLGNINNPYSGVFSRNGMYGVTDNFNLLSQQQQNPLLNPFNNIAFGSNANTNGQLLYNTQLLNQLLSSGWGTSSSFGSQNTFPFQQNTNLLSSSSGRFFKRSSLDPVLMDPKSEYFTLINNPEDEKRSSASNDS